MYKKCINKILSLTLLTTNEIQEICEKAIEVLIKESNLPNVQSPVLVCGDIHGQIYDLVEVFKMEGDPSKQKFIFLGNYVDRGENSTECIFLLLIYKILYPENIYLIRGNHEQKTVSKSYGLYDEILKKYDVYIWRLLCEVFSFFNVGCIVDGRIFCVHGGISPKTMSVNKLKRIDRFVLDTSDIYEDILCSDPHDEEGFKSNKQGIGSLYGADVANSFLECNDLTNIIRSHQFAFEGYKFHFPNRNAVTVWGAPDFLGKFGNPGSFMRVKEDLVISTRRLCIYNYATRSVASLEALYDEKY
ncbi:serine/threonine-protein phosphatase 4 catalytic subunit (PP4C) [Vairimorpha necatrix]|uniref:Serine/threonine-protein phosphatase n=1 Tax=Vairimorpha necatrix TaxID=6039 RepID=A0AAX4JAS9_9MICR